MSKTNNFATGIAKRAIPASLTLLDCLAIPTPMIPMAYTAQRTVKVRCIALKKSALSLASWLSKNRMASRLKAQIATTLATTT